MTNKKPMIEYSMLSLDELFRNTKIQKKVLTIFLSGDKIIKSLRAKAQIATGSLKIEQI